MPRLDLKHGSLTVWFALDQWCIILLIILYCVTLVSDITRESAKSYVSCHGFCAATSVDKGDCMGGSTLSLLHDRTFNYTGDSQAQELCLYLTKAASVPYFEILEKWIYRGIIKDPYGYRN